MTLRIISLSVVILLAIVLHTPVQARSVWIDTDPSCGLSKTSDVDDCWALHLALQSPQLVIRGISTVFGNAKGVETYGKAKEVMAILAHGKVSISVFRGSDNKLDPKRVALTDATSALIKQLEQEPTTLIALGPVTNIAQLILLRPDLVSKINEILVVAGRRAHSESRFYPGRSRIYHMHDFNFRKDVGAFAVLLESSIPLTMLPYELASKVRMTAEDLQAVAQNPSTKWLEQSSKQWLLFWRQKLLADGFHPFDSLAIHYLNRPKAYSCELLNAKVVHKPSLFLSSRDDLVVSHEFEGHPVNYCYNLTGDIRTELTGG